MDPKKNIQEYLNEISSNSPTPGGGNVSAFTGALAASLGIMVCNLTIGKKKYIAHDAEMIQMRDELQNLRMALLSDSQADNEAFDQVMLAFKLPKELPEEIELRKCEIEKATVGAAEVPSAVISKCLQMTPLLGRLSEIGNQNSLSDTAVACQLASAAANGAFMNVLINCNSLNSDELKINLLSGATNNIELLDEEIGNILKMIKLKLNG